MWTSSSVHSEMKQQFGAYAMKIHQEFQLDEVDEEAEMHLRMCTPQFERSKQECADVWICRLNGKMLRNPDQLQEGIVDTLQQENGQYQVAHVCKQYEVKSPSVHF